MDLYSDSKYHLPVCIINVYTINNHFFSYKYQLLTCKHALYNKTDDFAVYESSECLYKSSITYSCVPMNHI